MLMMVCVLVGFAEIFLGVLVEGFLAAERAEVVGLPVVLGCASGGGRVNIHAADGIMYGCCHSCSFCWIISLGEDRASAKLPENK